MRRSFETSPSRSLVTGMPVHLATTSAMSSGVTSSVSIFWFFCRSASRFSARAISFSMLAAVLYFSSAAFA